MRRVVVTGIGIISCLGNDQESVAANLKAGKSGIRFVEQYKEMGFRSHVAGTIDFDAKEVIDRKTLRFMCDASAYSYAAMQQAITDSGLEDNEVSHERTGIIVGSGGSSPENIVGGVDTLREKGFRKVSPYLVPRVMSSTTTACLATPFKIKGVNYSITSACSTSAHCIGNAYELIQWGKQDIVFAGGGEEQNYIMTLYFDAMGALSSKYNETPERASRPYDADRDGFVISGGGGMVVLEELEHAKARGAKIYAEVVGYGATSDGHNMVAPSGEGATRCMKLALETVNNPIDYVNAHGTSTPAGDIVELNALKAVFGDELPYIGSTKSLSGHSLGAAGVHESIYSLLMMQHGFMAASANIENLDEGAIGFPLLKERRDNIEVNTALSNSFGFGGTNATLAFQKYV